MKQIHGRTLLLRTDLSAALLGDCAEGIVVGVDAAESRKRGILLGRPLFLLLNNGDLPALSACKTDALPELLHLSPCKLSLCIRATCGDQETQHVVYD